MTQPVSAIILDGIRFRAYEAGSLDPDSIVFEPDVKKEESEEKEDA